MKFLVVIEEDDWGFVWKECYGEHNAEQFVAQFKLYPELRPIDIHDHTQVFVYQEN